MELLWNIASETWLLTCQMAPYLVSGFLVAGILSVVVTPARVQEHLGGRGLWQVVKAALIGVPLPLCSCSVLPVSASLRRHGAGRGATLSFLVSTPQTGVDSIMVTQSLLGPVFVVFRLVVAFVSGILAGVLVDHWGGRASCAESDAVDSEPSCCGGRPRPGPLTRILRYGFVTLPGEMGRAMLLGIVLAGVLTALIPEGYFADKVSPGLVAMLVMMLVGIPMYVCSSGSVPVALALIHMGISPGAALVFLVTGPATNAAAVTTIWKLLGRRAVGIYLFTIAITALVAGWIMDTLPFVRKFGEVVHAHHDHLMPRDQVWGVILAVILVAGAVRPLLKLRA